MQFMQAIFFLGGNFFVDERVYLSYLSTMNLKTYRKNKKMSLATLGEILGVSAVTVHRYENGTRKPGLSTLERIYKVTRGQVRANDFFSDAA